MCAAVRFRRFLPYYILYRTNKNEPNSPVRPAGRGVGRRTARPRTVRRFLFCFCCFLSSSLFTPLPHIAQRWARRGGVFRQSAGIRGKKSCNILYNPTLRNAPGFGKMDTSTSTSYFWAGGRLCPIGHGVPAHCDAAVCLCLCHFCVKAGGIRLYGRVRVLNPDGRAQCRRPPQ